MKNCSFATIWNCFSSCREIEACNGLLASLCSGFGEALKLRTRCDRGQLIPDGTHKADQLFKMADELNQISFYGRCVGFQVSINCCSVSRSFVVLPGQEEQYSVTKKRFPVFFGFEKRSLGVIAIFELLKRDWRHVRQMISRQKNVDFKFFNISISFDFFCL